MNLIPSYPNMFKILFKGETKMSKKKKKTMKMANIM